MRENFYVVANEEKTHTKTIDTNIPTHITRLEEYKEKYHTAWIFFTICVLVVCTYSKTVNCSGY